MDSPAETFSRTRKVTSIFYLPKISPFAAKQKKNKSKNSFGSNLDENEVQSRLHVIKYLSILRRLPDNPDVDRIINKMKNSNKFDFVYLVYIVPKESLHYSHFCLKVAPYKDVDKSNMTTLSTQGVMNITNIQTFTTFENWEYEYRKFCEIRELKFFKDFRMWKAFHLWKKTIMFRKFTKNRKKIIGNCFAQQKLFGYCLLQQQEKKWITDHENFTKLDIHEDTPFYYFIENQVDELEKVMRILDNYNTFMMDIMKKTFASAVTRKNIDIDNPTRSRFYIERTQKRNYLSRIRCFLKLVDYITITMLHLLMKRSHIKMTDMLKIHFNYTPTEETLSKMSFSALIESLPRPEKMARWPLFQIELDLDSNVVPFFDPTQKLFNDEFRSIFRRWNDAVESIKRFQLEPDFEVYFAEEPRTNEYRRQLWHILSFTLKLDADLQNDIIFLDEFIDKGFRNIWLLLDKFHDMWELFREDLTMTEEKMRAEFELNTLKDWCVRYNTEMKSNDEIFPYQAMGLFFLRLVYMKAKIIQTPTELFAMLSQHMSDIGALKVRQLIESCDKVNEELDFIPETCEEIVEFTSMLDDIELTVQRLEGEQDYVRELYNMLDEYGISIPKDELNDYLGLNRVLGKLRYHIDEVLKTRENLITKFEKKINKEILILQVSLASILEDSKEPWLVDIESDPQTVLDNLEQVFEAFTVCNDRYKQIQNWQRAFKLNVTRLDVVPEIITEIQIRQLLWRSHLDWSEFITRIYQENFYDIDLEELTTTVANFGKNYHKLERAFPENVIVERLRDEVEVMKEKLTTITYLKNPALKARHWAQIESILSTRFTVDVVVTLQLLEDLNVFSFEEKFMEISGLASSEESLEAMLKKVEDIWKLIELPVLPYKDNIDIFMLGSLEDVQTAIDESMMHIGIILSSRQCGNIKSRVEEWERLLNIFSKTLNEWFQCMQTWMYLEVLFSSPDIQRQLPTEAKLFTQVDKSWKEIMRKVAKVPLALAAASDVTLLDTFEHNNKLLDRIMKSLEAYLTIKRLAFPRFFFLSNDELLEILAQTRNPHAVQPHLRKCFDAIAKLEFAAEEKTEEAAEGEEKAEELSSYIIAMISPENEKVSFGKGLKARGNVEEWLKKVEENMFAAVRRCLKFSLGDFMKKPRTEWIQQHPNQVVLTASQIMWAGRVHEILDLMNTEKIHKKMIDFETENISDLNDCAGLTRLDLSGLFRKVLCALMTIDIHARDTITSMKENYVTGPDSFEWLKMIRYYWDESVDNCVVKMSSSWAYYGYEYIGAGGVLVITPLTDRCYLCLMGAIQLDLGGAPAGPAGTGKTETTKDLAKSLAIQCVVFNCSEGLDFRMMGKFFSGLASSGAWCCFDEFNRINIEVLSVIAQQLITIRNAKLAKKKRFVFEGLEISLIPTCAVFITMNPGYAGRTELPDNLKSLFRPISMMVPDYSLIAEVILYSEGFQSSRNLAKKMVQMYKLSSEQLSKQDHYDFGMRAVKSVLVMAGALKRASPDQPDEVTLLCALRDSNLPKFLAEDAILFAAILGDLFPGVEIPFRDYSVMENVIKFVLLRNKLQIEPTQINKVIQLYETMVVRWGVMTVGPSGGGKTTVLTTLGESFDELYRLGTKNPYFRPVRKYVMNPKSLTMEELYGGVNPLTLEWRDGLLAISLRVAVQCLEDDHQWIVCDGPVDAVWIENMNTVLDDNKMLCLANSERIKLTPYVHMVFEVGDLAQASPATVSRCGMVFVDPSELRWMPYVKSWLQELPETKLTTPEIKHLINELMDNIDPGFTFIRRECQADIAQVDISKAAMLCSILESLLMMPVDPFDDKLEQTVYITKIFIFAYIWAIGGNLSDASKVKFQLFVASQFVDEEGDLVLPTNLWDSYINNKAKEFNLWQQIIPDFLYKDDQPFFEIIVPTKDTVRYGYVMDMLMKLDRPVLFVGNTGVGKSVIAKYILNKLQATGIYLPCVMNFSAQTDSGKTQELFESRLDRRKKNVLGAPWGKKVIIFIDDVNMPKLDVYGSQATIELLRQYLDFGGLYDRELMYWKYIKDVVMCAACAPPGGGRNPLTARFVRHFAMLYITNPSEDTQKTIFQSILRGHFTEFIPEVRVLADQIINAAVDAYAKVLARLLPTPAKSHYVFNLRDLSKCVQGVLQSDAGNIKEPMQVLRLFYHECTRTFHDRLICIEDRSLFFHMMREVCNKHFGQPIMEFEQTPILEKPPLILFGDFLNYGVAKENRIYEEIRNLDAMKEILGFYLTEYNAAARYEMKLVLFTDAAEHVVRIARVLRAERGHGLLLGPGGSGRRSLARLAGYINEYKCFGMEITRDYDINSFHDDLRELYINTGIKEEDTVFLFTDSQILQEQFLEDVNNMLNSGEVPNLFGGEDLEKVFIACRSKAADAGYNASDKESVYVYFINKIRTKLHLCICMSPVGDVFRRRCRMFPSLVNCCSIDWFEKWPPEALYSVAVQLIDAKGNAELADKLSQVCVLMHETTDLYTAKLLKELNRYFYTTPSSYLDLLKLYSELLNKKIQEILGKQARLNNGLGKLYETYAVVGVMEQDIMNMKPVLESKTTEAKVMMNKVMEEEKEIGVVREAVMKDEAEANEQAAATQALADDAARDLAEVMPVMEAAQDALKSLNKADINELRVFQKPPALVKFVMEPICLLLGAKTDWDSAKKVLGDSNFLKKLQDYDKDHIKEAMLKKIKVYIDDANFDPDIIVKVSKVCRSMCLWVKAVHHYAIVFRDIEPKIIKQKQAEETLKGVMKLLKQKKDELAAVEAKLELAQNVLKKIIDETAALQAQLDLAEARLNRAEKLTQALSDEQVRWELSMKSLGMELEYSTGNIIVAAGCVAYFGAFPSSYRADLVAEWVVKCRSLDILISSTYNTVSILADSFTIREWNSAGLPRDAVSIENGIYVTKARRFPLMIDPQEQANRWIRNMERDNTLQIVKFRDSNYMKILESCIRLGRPALIEDIAESLDPNLTPILQKCTFLQGGRLLIRLGDTDIEYDPNFRVYITTKLANPHYLPDVCILVTIVNFTVTLLGLEDQLLADVVKLERPDLELQRSELITQINRDTNQLLAIEDKILRMLYTSQGNILDDEELIETLNEGKETASVIGARLIETEAAEKDMTLAREKYRPIATRGAVLYFVVATLSAIDSMYQYSLKYFQQIFNNVIETSTKVANFEEYLVKLKQAITLAVYQNISRGLFEKDKLIYSFLILTGIYRHEGRIPESYWNFVLRGPVGSKVVVGKKPPIPSLTDGMWLAAHHLDDVFPSFKGLRYDCLNMITIKIGSLTQVIDISDLKIGSIINWDHQLDLFEKLVLLKALKSEVLVDAITQYISVLFGKGFIESPVVSLNSLYLDTSNRTPLIFILSKGYDPFGAFQKFAMEIGYGDRIHSISLGQGQGPIAEKLIAMGIVKGDWIFLQNCHLAASWMTAMEEIVQKICTDTEPPNETFRLFMSTMPAKEFPVSVLQNSVKVTKEPPKGLKANVRGAFQEIDVNFFEKHSLGVDWCSMIFGLCLFHGIIQERKKFGPLGWTIIYEFNDNDRECALLTLEIFCKTGVILWDALEYITGEITYGGRVTDVWDLRCLKTILYKFFAPHTLNEGYTYSASGVYYCPKNAKIAEFQKYIEELPIVDEPEVFGMHDNANIAFQNEEVSQYLTNLIKTQTVQSAEGEGETPVQIVFRLSEEIKKEVPKKINLDFVHPKLLEKDSMGRAFSHTTVLLHEIQRYNKFLSYMHNSLIDLQKAIKGVIVMSDDLENIFNSFMNNEVPSIWSNKSYNSMLKLGSWVHDLILRIDYMDHWMQNQQSVSSWISGLFFPQGLLTATLQAYSRSYGVSINQLIFDFEPQPVFLTQDDIYNNHMSGNADDVFQGLTKPDDGILVHGLYIDAGRWDIPLMKLVDALPGERNALLPVFWLYPVTALPVPDPRYVAPLYKTPARAGVLSTTGHSTNFVIPFLLATNEDQSYWILRGTALITQVTE